MKKIINGNKESGVAQIFLSLAKSLSVSCGILSCSQARWDTLCNPSNMFWVCLQSPPSWKCPLKYLLM